MSICNHGKQKPHCKICGGSAFCIHGKQKSRCKSCGGSAFCNHNKRIDNCKECRSNFFCNHGKKKYSCIDCDGTNFCDHGKEKYRCKICVGSGICLHNKQKRYCKECGGSGLCKTPFCETYGNRKYGNHCLRCYIHLFPDQKITRNYKTKERNIVDSIKIDFPDLTWIHDKKIEDGCSKYRPDLLLDMGTHIIIIEIDENKHVNYNCNCENKRLMTLSQDLQHRPIILIRFNPDSYKNEKGELVKSCWRTNKLGIFQIEKSKEPEWRERLHCLKQQIKYWIENPTEKILEIVELFY